MSLQTPFLSRVWRMAAFWFLASLFLTGVVYVTGLNGGSVSFTHPGKNEPMEWVCLKWMWNLVMFPFDIERIFNFKYHRVSILLWLVFNSLLRGIATVYLCRLFQAFVAHTNKLFRLTTFTVIGGYCIVAYVFMWPPIVTHKGIHTVWRCRGNLRQIDGAIYEFCAEHPGKPFTIEDIVTYLELHNNGRTLRCPDGGIYRVSDPGVYPTCSLGTNTTEPKKIRVQYFHWDENPKFRDLHK